MKDPPPRTRRLRKLLTQDELVFLMEAHSGLSARIAEEAGFAAIWASGLAISASLGVRDNNEASWTQVLDVVEFMCDASTVPVLVDGDTGYGDFNTMRRVVRKLESRGVAGICIEDKLFPKTNSFIAGNQQPLADIDEFCGKIRAGQDARSDDAFVLVARVEAFIAGRGLEEAIKRATAYHEAGADAILIHSARRDPSEVFAFLDEWANRAPVILVPTKYFTTPTSAYRDRNVSAVIWANHLMRSSVKAMQETSRRIFEEQSLTGVESRIAPVAEVFRLQGADELAEAEHRYLPAAARRTKAIILAFTRGVEMESLTLDRPKAMVSVGGRPLLAHIADAFREAGVRELHAVCGYRQEAIDVKGITKHSSPTENRRSEVLALSAALSEIQGAVIVAYGDVLFKKFLIDQMSEATGDFTVLVDSDWQTSRNRERYADYVHCTHAMARMRFYSDVSLLECRPDLPEARIHGEWMGFLRLSACGSEIVSELIRRLVRDNPEQLDGMDMGGLLNQIISAGHEIEVLYTTGNWLDCDSVADALEGTAFQ